MCHNFDYLNWLFGKGEISSSLLGYSSGFGLDVEDTAEVGMTFPGDIIGSLHLNFTQQPPKHILEIVGTEGTINWNYYQNRVDLFQLSPRIALGRCRHYFSPADFDRNDLFIDEMKHFLDIIENDVDPVCTLEDGIQVLENALEAKERRRSVTSYLSLLPEAISYRLRRLKFMVFQRERYLNFKGLRMGISSEGYSLVPFDELQCIFIHIPKCAGQSVRATLFNDLQPGHINVYTYQQIFPRSIYNKVF